MIITAKWACPKTTMKSSDRDSTIYVWISTWTKNPKKKRGSLIREYAKTTHWRRVVDFISAMFVFKWPIPVIFTGKYPYMQARSWLSIKSKATFSNKVSVEVHWLIIASIFLFQGDQIHWLACTLYEACRRSIVPTVGRGTVEGNCVSLTRLLRSAKFRYVCHYCNLKSEVSLLK